MCMCTRWVQTGAGFVSSWPHLGPRVAFVRGKGLMRMEEALLNALHRGSGRMQDFTETARTLR